MRRGTGDACDWNSYTRRWQCLIPYRGQPKSPGTGTMHGASDIVTNRRAHPIDCYFELNLTENDIVSFAGILVPVPQEMKA